jgi:hypothetical protein
MKLLQITQELEGYYVLESSFYCLFKLQYFTPKLILIRTIPPDCVAEGRVRYLFAEGRVRCLCTQTSESMGRRSLPIDTEV